MRTRLAAPLAAFLVLGSGIAGAQEVTLKGITSFAEKTFYSRGFEKFIDKVNADGKGKVQINYIGGPKAMPPFEVGNALKGGVVDIANVTGAFYTNVFPEADAWKLTERPMAELRSERRLRLHGEALRREDECRVPRAAHRRQPVPSLPDEAHRQAGPDGSQAAHHAGLPRVLPGARRHRGADPPGEVYTALERGVVDGYGWPITGIFDLGWHEKHQVPRRSRLLQRRGEHPHQQGNAGKLNAEQKKVIIGRGRVARRRRPPRRPRRTRPTPRSRRRPASR